MVAELLPRLIGGSLLATGGWRLGEYVSDTWGPELYVPWVLGLAGVGLLLGFVATPFFSSRVIKRLAASTGEVPTSRLLSVTLGIVVGLLVALLLSIPLSRVPGWFGIGLPIALSIFLAYLGAMLMALPERDVFQNIMIDSPLAAKLNGHSNGNNNSHNSQILLDTSAIIDGRIASISVTGFLRGTLLVPQFILDELRHVADSSDSLRRARGRRGLEVLNTLREDAKVPIEVIDVDFEDGRDVDAKLIAVAKMINASIATTDYNLNRVAQIQGVAVLNVNDLANSLKPVVLPGEDMNIRIVQEGKEPGQGVGFLDDGTMVVVESGQRHVNSDMSVVVTRVLQNSAGCIIFAQPKRS